MIIDFLGYYLLFGLLWALATILGNFFAEPKDKGSAFEIGVLCVLAIVAWFPVILMLIIGIITEDKKKGL